jgi:hypothetical protein
VSDTKPRHENNGNCAKCDELFNKYPSFFKPLRDWFKALQAKHPEAHISCAGRGKKEQEEAYDNRRSRAHWGESAHNYNAALDLFEMQGKREDIYELAWFNSIVSPNIPDSLNWYGRPDSRFFELPHVEVKNWQSLAKKKVIKLVE